MSLYIDPHTDFHTDSLPCSWLTNPWGSKGKSHLSWPLKSSLTPCFTTIPTASAELKGHVPGGLGLSSERSCRRGWAEQEPIRAPGVACRGIWLNVCTPHFTAKKAFRRFVPSCENHRWWIDWGVWSWGAFSTLHRWLERGFDIGRNAVRRSCMRF